jgi:phosphoribosylformimino-5-aminoimidazole carboxamide ribotide isomerase
VEAGARALHLVDLDGARGGAPAGLHHLQRIAAAVPVPVQWGGGLRTAAAVSDALAAGADRVVLGTAAIAEPTLLDGLLAEHGERIAVAVDVRDGRVAARGWTQRTDQGAPELIDRLREQGVPTIVYTNVDRDGMLEGPDTAEVEEIVRRAGTGVIYSGGIGSLDDLRSLANLEQTGLAGVIVGKALFEGRFGVQEGQAALA